MRYIIETFQRENGDHVALFTPEGELLTTSGVGGGTTEREAVQAAANSYYSRAAESEPFTLSSPRFVLRLGETETLGSQSILDHRCETTQQGIVQFAKEAIASEPTPRLRLHYTDSQGTDSVRDIYPSEVKSTRPGYGGFLEERYLVAVDCEQDEPRTFRLDRIRALENASG